MGLFRVRGRLTGPTGRTEDAELLIDTGATLLVVPRLLAERLELVARRSQPVLIARGREYRALTVTTALEASPASGTSSHVPQDRRSTEVPLSGYPPKIGIEPTRASSYSLSSLPEQKNGEHSKEETHL